MVKVVLGKGDYFVWQLEATFWVSTLAHLTLAQVFFMMVNRG